MKYNAIIKIIEFEDQINISIVTPDHQEHEITIERVVWEHRDDAFALPAEYFVHPACCEHPNGCPDGTRTEELLKEYNEK